MLLNLKNNIIDAISIGGINTSIAIKNLNLCFDMGLLLHDSYKYGTVCITHTHIDHLGAIASHFAQRDLKGLPTPNYLVPADRLELIKDLFTTWHKLDRINRFPNFIPMEPDKIYRLSRTEHITAFRSVHTTPTLGYTIWRERKQLKPEFQGYSESQIKGFALAGEIVQSVVPVPEITFCGDTTIDVIDREPIIRTSKLLILECTLLDNRHNVSKESARRNGHIHLDDIIERKELFKNEKILLTHFSARYKRQEILQIFSERIPDLWNNRVELLLPE